MNVLKASILALVASGWVAAPALCADGVQQEKQFEKDVTVKVKMGYLLFLPENYDKTNQKYPLILFLHGAGESGTNLALVKKHGPPKIVEAKKDFPFIVVSPQSPGRGWNVEALGALLDEIVSQYKVDQSPKDCIRSALRELVACSDGMGTSDTMD